MQNQRVSDSFFEDEEEGGRDAARTSGNRQKLEGGMFLSDDQFARAPQKSQPTKQTVQAVKPVSVAYSRSPRIIGMREKLVFNDAGDQKTFEVSSGGRPNLGGLLLRLRIAVTNGTGASIVFTPANAIKAMKMKNEFGVSINAEYGLALAMGGALVHYMQYQGVQRAQEACAAVTVAAAASSDVTYDIYLPGPWKGTQHTVYMEMDSITALGFSSVTLTMDIFALDGYDGPCVKLGAFKKPAATSFGVKGAEAFFCHYGASLTWSSALSATLNSKENVPVALLQACEEIYSAPSITGTFANNLIMAFGRPTSMDGNITVGTASDLYVAAITTEETMPERSAFEDAYDIVLED